MFNNNTSEQQITESNERTWAYQRRISAVNSSLDQLEQHLGYLLRQDNTLRQANRLAGSSNNTLEAIVESIDASADTDKDFVLEPNLVASNNTANSDSSSQPSTQYTLDNARALVEESLRG